MSRMRSRGELFRNGIANAAASQLTRGPSISTSAVEEESLGVEIKAGRPSLLNPLHLLFAGPGAPADDPRIVELSARILAISKRVAADYNQQVMRTGIQLTPTQFGTELHVRFARALSMEDIPGVEVEQSFKGGRDVEYGESGSRRTDVILRDESKVGDDGKGLIVAVWDYKTGATDYVAPSRRRALAEAIHSDLHLQAATPVIILHVPMHSVPRP